MRALTIIALALLFQPALQNQAGIVSGIVTRTDGITPLSEVRIELVETFPSQRLRKPFAAETTTDGAGRFMVRNVPEGEFEVRATLDGFLDHGESVTGARATALVNLTTGRRVEVRLALAAGSTVRGRLVDDEGRPVESTVGLIQEHTNEEGRRSWTTRHTARTDKNGEYRISLVRSGNYYVRTNRSDRRGSVYFPGTLDPDAAAPISVREGDEVVADIRMPPSSEAPTFALSGRIVHSVPVIDDWPSGVRLTRQDRKPLEDDVLVGAVDHDTGKFEVTAAPPGIYDLLVTLGGGQNRYMSKVVVDLRHGDVRDLAVSVSPGVDVKARLVVEGSPSSFVLSRDLSSASASVLSNPARPNMVHVSLQGNDVPYRPQWWLVDEPGMEVTFPNVPRGHYLVLVRLEPDRALPNSYVADVRVAGRSVYDDGIRVGIDPVDAIEVIVGSEGGSIEGMISGKGNAAVAVVMVPDVFRRKNAALYKRELVRLADGTGSVRIRGIAPGNYKIFAVPDNGETLPFRSPDFAARFEARAVAITVQRGGRVAGIQIPLLPLDR